MKMNIKKMKGSLIGIVFIVLSVVIYALYPDDSIASRGAISTALIGLFLLFMRVNYNVPDEVTGRVIESTTASVYDILSGLHIKGKGIFLPPVGEGGSDRVFVPLHEGSDIPDIKRVYDKSVFVTDNVSKNFGLLLNSPGGGIIDLMEKESDTPFKGIGSDLMCETIKVLEGLDILDSIDADHEEGQLKISFSHSNYDENCERIRNDLQEVCEKSCCPICSCILSSFARSEGRPLQILEVKRKNKVYIKARFLDI